MLLKNGKYLTEEGFLVENPGILIKDGKISKIGCDDDEDVIDLTGKVIYPGFIDAHCHTGVEEQDKGFEGNDINDVGNPNQCDVRGIDGFNPFDTGVIDALNAGVTTINTGPGSANCIGGTFTTVKTYGTVVDKMCIRKDSAMKIAFGENPKTYHGKNQNHSPFTRPKIMAILREQILSTISYIKDPSHKFDMKCEAFKKVIDKEIPLKAHCHRADDIASAIRLQKEFNLDMTLDHVTEGHLIKEYIKESNLPAIVGPSFGGRTKIELKNKTYKTAGELSNIGVKVAIMTDAPVIPLDHLPLCAALAVRDGMKREDGYRAITINPAEIMKVSDRVGSIKEGKDADFAIYNRDFMEYVDAKCVMTIVDGKVVYEAI